MRVLLDQGTPAPLRRALSGHEVDTAYERGWSMMQNGELLDSAEREGFDVLVTTDANLGHQQDLSTRTIAIVVPSSTSWPGIQQAIPEVVEAISNCQPASLTRVAIP